MKSRQRCVFFSMYDTMVRQNEHISALLITALLFFAFDANALTLKTSIGSLYLCASDNCQVHDRDAKKISLKEAATKFTISKGSRNNGKDTFTFSTNESLCLAANYFEDAEIYGEDVSPLQSVFLTDCKINDAAQSWMLKGDESSYNLINVANKLCLTSHHKNFKEGMAYLDNCDEDNHFQAWQFDEKAELKWHSVNEPVSLPSHSLKYPFRDNHPYYVGRVISDVDKQPGKVRLIERDKAYFHICNFSLNDREEVGSTFEVCTIDGNANEFSWFLTDHKSFAPLKAVKGGFDAEYEYYICRAFYKDGMHSGKLFFHAKNGWLCSIGWGGREAQLTKYEFLGRIY